MKTIGLVGGLSFESTAICYRLINEQVRRRRGRLHSARILTHSLDAEETVALYRRQAWDEVADQLVKASCALYASGARTIALCGVTAHHAAGRVRDALPPGADLLHIGDSVGAAIRESGLRRVGLFGSLQTMEQGFFSDYLFDCYGIESIIPSPKERQRLQEIVYDELYLGRIRRESRQELAVMAGSLRSIHATEAILLGSTELGALIGEATGPFPLPRFDSLVLHARNIADNALRVRRTSAGPDLPVVTNASLTFVGA